MSKKFCSDLYSEEPVDNNLIEYFLQDVPKLCEIVL